MTKIRKWFWVWKADEEKRFLEEKAAEGLVLTHVGIGVYYFRESEPKEYVYQMDFRGLDTKMSEDDYLQIYEDAGWKLVSKLGGWYYFCQERKDDMELSIFNDNASKAKIYKRIILFLLITGFPLYYSVIMIFPNMPDSRTAYPGFLFFFRIFCTLIMALHVLGVLKIFRMYRNLKKDFRE